MNTDESYTEKQGQINNQWHTVADKHNASPYFNMKVINRVTAKARFKALLTRFSKWEAEFAAQSGTDESDTLNLCNDGTCIAYRRL